MPESIARPLGWGSTSLGLTVWRLADGRGHRYLVRPALLASCYCPLPPFGARLDAALHSLPSSCNGKGATPMEPPPTIMGDTELESVTSAMSRQRSNQLS